MLNGDPSILVGAIQPLITKCNPGDEEVDIDVIKSIITNQLKQELNNEINSQNQKKEIKANFEGAEDNPNEEQKEVDENI